MKYKIKSSGEGTFVPCREVMNVLDEADSIKFKVLFCVLNDPDYDPDEICERLDITKRRLTMVLSFWEKAGVLEADGIKVVKHKNEKTSARKLMSAAEMPKYSSEEVARFVESHAAFRELLTNCQNEIGRFFNLSETEVLIGMIEYLNLDEAYIGLLFGHMAKMGKKSLRYIEKTAIGLVDKGILTYAELDDYIKRAEATASAEGTLRNMFGIGTRALVKKEREAFERWCGEWQMPLDVIEKAFEVTVENTKGASVPYCNAVLERWHAEGYKTLEEVESAVEKYKHDKNDAVSKKGSFDTDDFFEAALQRSYKN